MNFNNWKGMHKLWGLLHTPTKKMKERFMTKQEAELRMKLIPGSKLKDKDPANYEVKDLTLKMQKLVKREHVHDRVFMCSECYRKQMAKIVEALRRRGNPIFQCSVICWAWKECTYYEAPAKPPMPCTTTPVSVVNMGELERYQEPNCAHIAAVDDVIYCKRRHPGAVVLSVEQTVINERRHLEYPLFLREMMEKFLHIYENPEVKAKFLAPYTGEEKVKKELEFDASCGALKSIINTMLGEIEQPKNDFLGIQPGDLTQQVTVCQEKVLVADDKVAEEIANARQQEWKKEEEKDGDKKQD
jgi:hypothetical protein